MDLQNFSSIFELFATFALAYIIIDELTENPFISLVTEKILRKYKPVDDIFSEIRGIISGHKTSLSNLAQHDIKDPKYIEGLPEINKILASTEERSNQSFSEIKTKIRKGYTTRMFVYINSFLFLFCLTVLFYGGVYESYNLAADYKHKVYNETLDDSLFFFTSLSVAYLIIGWFADKMKGEENLNLIEKIFNLFNGYITSFVAYLIIVILSILSFYFKWHIVHFENWPYHNILVVVCILTPISNFLIYIIKASRRANKLLPDLKTRADAYKSDYSAELEKVQSFIGMCDYLKTLNLEIKNGS